MEFELLQDTADNVGPFGVLVYAVECVTCGLHRQCWDVENLAVGRNNRDPGCNAETYRLYLTQFLHHGIDLPTTCSLRVENGLGVVEDYEDLL
jgi:hypothetical protein